MKTYKWNDTASSLVSKVTAISHLGESTRIDLERKSSTRRNVNTQNLYDGAKMAFGSSTPLTLQTHTHSFTVSNKRWTLENGNSKSVQVLMVNWTWTSYPSTKTVVGWVDYGVHISTNNLLFPPSLNLDFENCHLPFSKMGGGGGKTEE